MDKQALNPVFGVPHIYYDQLNIVTRHLHDIRLDTQIQQHTHGTDAILPTVAKLSRHIHKEKEDWAQWQHAEHQQLRQYKRQDTFGDLM